ncbi:MAG: MATE family efflux transporter [Dethiosulfovibrio peptidovorans]|nr:MAG: MATE family efflux transporter [Dethiosulfovibrio peptidovorans]
MSLKSRSSRMGQEPVGWLLFQFSIPAIVGMVASALYNIVDRMFIGHVVGSRGLAAVTVTFPFFLFIIASGILIGVGTSSQISRALGEGRHDWAQAAMGNGIMAMMGASILVISVGAVFMDDLMRLCGATPALMPMIRSYLEVILWGVPFQLVSFCGNYFIRAEGHPRHAMWTLILGAGGNVVLDWLFIVRMNMGVRGAALGTVLAQVVASLWVLSFYVRRMGGLDLREIRPQRDIMVEMVTVGFSPCMMEMFFVLIMVVLNRTLSRLGGEVAVSAMGIFFSLDSLLFMPVVGIGEGAQPLIGYNYGAGKFDRVSRTVFLAMTAAVVFFLGSLVVAETVPHLLVRLFNDDNRSLADLAVRAIRIGYAGAPMAGVAIISAFFFQALGKARQSLALNLCRQVLFLLPPLILLPPLMGVDGAWLSFPIMDVGGGLMGGWMVRSEMARWRRSDDHEAKG